MNIFTQKSDLSYVSTGHFVPVPIWTTPQELDSRTGYTTSPANGYTWYASSSFLGSNMLHIQGNSNSTNCYLTPTQYWGPQINVNVLKCEPKFIPSAEGVSGVPRLAIPQSPNKVQVFLDPTTLGPLADELDAALVSWNNALASPGAYMTPVPLSFERVSQDCGNGPSCIEVTATGPPGVCGAIPNPLPTDAAGYIVGQNVNLTLNLNPTWSTFSSLSIQALREIEWVIVEHFRGRAAYM